MYVGNNLTRSSWETGGRGSSPAPISRGKNAEAFP